MRDSGKSGGAGRPNRNGNTNDARDGPPKRAWPSSKPRCVGRTDSDGVSNGTLMRVVSKDETDMDTTIAAGVRSA